MSKSKFTDPEEVNEDLKRSKTDSLVTLTNASITLIPIMGGPLSILLGAILPSITDRQNKWLISLTNDIQRLNERNDNFLNNLKTDENFISIVMQASQIAIRNHQEEKLEALHNAVLNSALKISLEEDMQLMFLNLIDSFTIYHMKILMLIHKPKEYLKNLNKEPIEGHLPVATFIEHVFPELKGKEDFYKAIWDDLYRRNLFETDSNNIFSTFGMDSVHPNTSELGSKFIIYISSPIEKD